MNYPIQQCSVAHTDSPHLRMLQEVPAEPANLFWRGHLPPANLVLLSVVGSRKYSSYGQSALNYLIGGLAGYNVGIVSGLALGIDGLAHQAALENDLYTLAIPGSGLSDTVLYPARHRRLAGTILESGGGLLSEYAADQTAAPWTFPQRNRLVVGISQATLVIEAAEQSGSLISAKLAVDYNRELLVVPGSIFSHTSRGTHQFLKLGATPITTAEDIISLLKLVPVTHTATDTTTIYSALETKILDALAEPMAADLLVQRCNLPTATIMQTLMELELRGVVAETNGTYIHRR